MLAAFVFGFTSLSCADRRGSDGSTVIYWFDKVPFILHLAVCAGLFAGAASLAHLWFYSLGVTYSPITPTIFAALAAAGWLLLFEFCCSVAHYVHSGRKIGDNIILIKLFRALLRLGAKAAGTLKYKPKKFKRNVILMSIIYVLANIRKFQ